MTKTRLPRAFPLTLSVLLPLALAAACSDPEPVNQTHQGRLEAGDEVLERDNSFYDEYEFEAKQGWQLTASMNSTDFDAYLILLDSDGNKVGENDDADDSSTNARIAMPLPKDGRYTLLANSYEGGQTGAYNLTIQTVAQ